MEIGGKGAWFLVLGAWSGVGGWRRCTWSARFVTTDYRQPITDHLPRPIHDARDQIPMRLVAGFDTVRGTGHLREQAGIGLSIPLRELSGETFYAGRTSRGKIGHWFPTPFQNSNCKLRIHSIPHVCIGMELLTIIPSRASLQTVNCKISDI